MPDQRVPQQGPARPGPDQPGSSPAAPTQPGPAQPGPAQPGPARPGPGRSGPANPAETTSPIGIGAGQTTPPDDPTPADDAARRRRLRVTAIAVAVAVVLLAGLVVVLTRGGTTPPGSSRAIGPIAPAEAHGRRPVTAVATSTGRTLTVAQDGSGQFRSLQQAADQAGPGDTVVIGAGEYAEPLVVNHDGAPNAFLTFTAAPGTNPVIKGSTHDRDGLVFVKDRKWIKLVGLTIRDSDRHGLYVVGSEHVVVQDVGVLHSQDGGAIFIDSSNVQVLHSEVRGNNAEGTEASNEAVTFSDVDNFEIGYSTVSDNGEEGIDAKYEATKGKIHDNTTDRNRGPNIYIDAANTIDVYNNTVTGATGENKAGISLGIEDVSKTRRTSGIRIYNNVVTGNAGGGISFFVESDGTFTDIDIVNNTVVSNPGEGINPRDYVFAGTNVLRNNIISGNERGDTAGRAATVFTADHNLFGNKPVGSDALVSRPDFVDAKNGDLRLAPESPGLNAGSPDGAPPADVNGAPRHEGGIDMGAYEDTGAGPAH